MSLPESFLVFPLCLPKLELLVFIILQLNCQRIISILLFLAAEYFNSQLEKVMFLPFPSSAFQLTHFTFYTALAGFHFSCAFGQTFMNVLRHQGALLICSQVSQMLPDEVTSPSCSEQKVWLGFPARLCPQPSHLSTSPATQRTACSRLALQTQKELDAAKEVSPAPQPAWLSRRHCHL